MRLAPSQSRPRWRCQVRIEDVRWVLVKPHTEAVRGAASASAQALRRKTLLRRHQEPSPSLPATGTTWRGCGAACSESRSGPEACMRAHRCCGELQSGAQVEWQVISWALSGMALLLSCGGRRLAAQQGVAVPAEPVPATLLPPDEAEGHGDVCPQDGSS